MARLDGRSADQLRKINIVPDFLLHPAGSCLIEMGCTRVVCSATLEETVPSFLKGSGKGWLTAEYGMLPGCSDQRVNRERSKVGGRTQEIQRLIGRALRSCIDLKMLGERSILIDCDVLDADGGTRTAAITGSFVALALALRALGKSNPALASAIKSSVAAVSVGLVGGEPLLDLNYEEDKRADVDMNIVKISDGRFVEVQGTAEATPFSHDQLNHLLHLASLGIDRLLEQQRKVLNW
ncbi:MAG: ribonuclease PH [Deltaproteobacteria bacterium]|nr:ribonuclease PH [Deltaproteobacteria bacterium]